MYTLFIIFVMITIFGLMDNIYHLGKNKYPRIKTYKAGEDLVSLLVNMILIFWAIEVLWLNFLS